MVSTILLNIPRIGYGTYRLKSGSYRHISDALECGYKIIERCFGILLIIIGVFYLLHTLKRLDGNVSH